MRDCRLGARGHAVWGAGVGAFRAAGDAAGAFYLDWGCYSRVCSLSAGAGATLGCAGDSAGALLQDWR